MRRDKQATMDKQFLDARSYVALDGREVLYGEDWKARKWDLWQRAKGMCEYMIFGNKLALRCPNTGEIPAHVIPRHPKRDDRLLNLKCYCIEHDRLTEKQSWRKVRSDRKERMEAANA